MARVKQVSYHHSSSHSRYPQAIHDSKQKICHDRGNLKKSLSKPFSNKTSRKDKRKLLKSKKPRLTKYELALAESTNSDGARVKLPEISKIYKSNSTCVRCAKTFPNIKLAVECLKLHNYARCTLCFDAIRNNLSVIDFVKQIHYDTHCKAIIRCPTYNLKQYADLKEFRSYVEDIHTDVGVCRDHEELVEEMTVSREQTNNPGENEESSKTRDKCNPSSSPELYSSINSCCNPTELSDICNKEHEEEKPASITDFNDNEYELNSSESAGDFVTTTNMEIIVDIQEGTGPGSSESSSSSRIVIREIRKVSSEEPVAKHEKLTVPDIKADEATPACNSAVLEVPRNSCQNDSKIKVSSIKTDGEQVNLQQGNSFVIPQEDSVCKKLEFKSEFVNNVKCKKDELSCNPTDSLNREVVLGKKVSKKHKQKIEIDLKTSLSEMPSVPSSSSSPAKLELFPVIINPVSTFRSTDASNPMPLKIRLKNIKHLSLSPEPISSKSLPSITKQLQIDNKKDAKEGSKTQSEPKKPESPSPAFNSFSPSKANTSVRSLIHPDKKQDACKILKIKSSPTAKCSKADVDLLTKKCPSSATEDIAKCTIPKARQKVEVESDSETSDSEVASSESSAYYSESSDSDIFEEIRVSKSFYLNHMKHLHSLDKTDASAAKSEKAEPVNPSPVVPKDEMKISLPDLYKGMPRLQMVQPIVPQNDLENSEPPILICYVPKAIDHELDNIVLPGQKRKVVHSISHHIKSEPEDSDSKSHSSTQENFITQDKCISKAMKISPSKKTLETLNSNGRVTTVADKILSKARKKHLTSVLSISKTEFSCKECHKKFATSYSLTRHENIRHRGLYPFVCNLCSTPKGFKDSWSLRRHAKSIHETVIPHFAREPGVIRTLQ